MTPEATAMDLRLLRSVPLPVATARPSRIAAAVVDVACDDGKLNARRPDSDSDVGVVGARRRTMRLMITDAACAESADAGFDVAALRGLVARRDAMAAPAPASASQPSECSPNATGPARP